MAKKKSAAQLRRLKARAEERGEEFIPPVATEEDNSPDNSSQPPEQKNNETKKSDKSSDNENKKDSKRLVAACKLKLELAEIQNNESLRAKERRSNKRKAEAIAAEEAGISVEEMQKWFEENQETLEKLEQKNSKSKSKKESDAKYEDQSHKTPYIVFVGQLSYETSKDALFQHIKSELGSEFKNITQETVKIRLLTDPKTKKSRGMAFVEADSPELMYACLSLHHTLLDGRRLNVERSAGGRKKETRDAKIKQFREKQEDYISKVVDSIIGEFIKTGELKEGELDEGAIAMCKRYSAGMVETAIKEYIESNGSTMDNTSAYFSFLLGKLATEKAEEGLQTSKGQDNGKKGDSKPFPSKRQKTSGSSIQEKNKAKKEKTSTVASQSALPQVDFTISEKGNSKQPAMSEMFPSLARRGRGRGYM